MNVSGSMPTEDGGISLQIVNFLQGYPSAIPIDFLAKGVGRRPEHLMEDLTALEGKGVITVNREGGTVALTEPNKSVLSAFFHWASGTL
jgi:hypothetical protein